MALLHPAQVACLLVRLSVAFAAFCVSNGVIVRANMGALKALAVVLLVPATAFAVMWAFGLRRTAWESLDPSKKVWWNDLRPVHAALYLVFSLMVLSSTMPRHAHAALFADVGVGLGAMMVRGNA